MSLLYSFKSIEMFDKKPLMGFSESVIHICYSLCVHSLRTKHYSNPIHYMTKHWNQFFSDSSSDEIDLKGSQRRTSDKLESDN